MDNAFFNKSLEGAVHGNTIKLLACFLLYITMGQSVIAFHKEGKYLPPAFRCTQLFPVQ
jgi:dolichol kinase